MTTAYLDIVIPQGSNYRFVVNVDGGPDDLTGYTGQMQVRRMRGDVETLADFGTSVVDVDQNNRQVIIEIPGSATVSHDWNRGVYDVLITGPLGPWRIVEGRVRLSPAITE